jgi:hypothetical protein
MTRLRYAPFVIGLFGFGQLASASDGQSVLFEHNGSQVRLDVRAGAAIMRYVEPRPALFAAGFDRNTLLFEGRLGADGSLQGLAYTYAAGCAPASYPVNGLWRQNDQRDADLSSETGTLAGNADSSVDIYFAPTRPQGRENWI